MTGQRPKSLSVQLTTDFETFGAFTLLSELEVKSDRYYGVTPLFTLIHLIDKTNIP